MQSQITHRPPSDFDLLPRFPGDILYLVAYFSSFETRINLVQCNKWLHETCTTLLFKQIYLHSPTQLIKLCDSEGATCMLKATDSIYLSERLFAPDSWSDEAIGDASELLIRVLRATRSLTRLQIFGSDRSLREDYQFHSNFEKKLRSAARDPAFLPNLEIIIELPNSITCASLCRNRPIIYHYYPNSPYMFAEICPVDGSGPNLKHNLSAHDVGILIQESQWTTPNEAFCSTCGIHIQMRFPEEIKRGSPSPVQDAWSWIKTMLLASKIPVDELYSLYVIFEPNPPYQSAAAQFKAVEELYKEYPELDEVTASYPELNWSRGRDGPRDESKSFPEDPLPDWTPHPHQHCIPDWIDWWLDALNLNCSGAQSLEELNQTTAKLIDAMRTRWDPEYDYIASSEAILEYLSNRQI